METKQTPAASAAAAGSFWWLNNSASARKHSSEREISSSLAEYLEHEQEAAADELDDDVDIPSILEEISRLSAKSPLGAQYPKDIGQLSIDEIMREAEKIYMESSKSFEQLSQRSKTSLNLSDSLKSETSTPTPKSLSPLPMDEKSQRARSRSASESDTESLKAPIDPEPAALIKSPTLTNGGADYSMEFDSVVSYPSQKLPSERNQRYSPIPLSKIQSQSLDLSSKIQQSPTQSTKESLQIIGINRSTSVQSFKEKPGKIQSVATVPNNLQEDELVQKDGVIKMLLNDNKGLKEELKNTLHQLSEVKHLQRSASTAELSKALEVLKDAQEQKTALQVQLEAANKTQTALRTTCDELLSANNTLERRVIDLDGVLSKYKADLKAIQSIRDKLKENEFNSNKLLEQERAQTKQLKQQVEKDNKCIMDLNRQIKEMERIIARKHPDSVSALIVASKYDEHGARKMFEERIKSLEQEALLRDAQNSKVFKDVQEKFNQMKLKYESHIEDLELHVNDLKSQLKRKGDTYDVYTQTRQYADKIIPAKDTTNRECQTEPMGHMERATKPAKKAEAKEDAHLLATIRGYQAELAAKEKIIAKAHKDLDELRKTNRRLQKEREGSLRTNFSDRKTVEASKNALVTYSPSPPTSAGSEGISESTTEVGRIRAQLIRVEGDYQALKAKRLQDLNTLQEAHEREMSNYLANVTPLREKVDMQTISLSALQQQLLAAKEELAIVTVERDHLNNKLNTGVTSLLQDCNLENGNENEAVLLRKKLHVLELKYEERENRLRAIVHGLAQKTITNRTCDQCAERQQQLIGYKVELDQIIATLRCMQ